MQEDKRNHLVKVDYGTNHYYADFLRKNPEYKGVITRAQFGDVLRDYNGFQRDRMATKGVEILFPAGLGMAELVKTKTEVKVDENGNVVNNLPVDWKRTRELWKERPDAKEKNIRIKFTNEHTDGYTFRIKYVKRRSKFKNKSIYKLRFNRELKRGLSKSIFEGKIDAFIR